MRCGEGKKRDGCGRHARTRPHARALSQPARLPTRNTTATDQTEGKKKGKEKWGTNKTEDTGTKTKREKRGKERSQFFEARKGPAGQRYPLFSHASSFGVLDSNATDEDERTNANNTIHHRRQPPREAERRKQQQRPRNQITLHTAALRHQRSADRAAHGREEARRRAAAVRQSSEAAAAAGGSGEW